MKFIEFPNKNEHEWIGRICYTRNLLNRITPLMHIIKIYIKEYTVVIKQHIQWHHTLKLRVSVREYIGRWVLLLHANSLNVIHWNPIYARAYGKYEFNEIHINWKHSYFCVHNLQRIKFSTKFQFNHLIHIRIWQQLTLLAQQIEDDDLFLRLWPTSQLRIV